MVLVNLLLLILLTALRARAAQAAPDQAQEALDALEDSLAAWQKDGLEPMGLPEALKVGSLQKSSPVPVLKHKRDPTVRSKPGVKQKRPQTDSEHPEVAEKNTTDVPNPQEHIESIFCHGTGCMIGIVIVLVAVPVGILMCSVAICWWYDRKRRLSGNQQECVGLMARPDSPSSLCEPDP